MKNNSDNKKTETSNYNYEYHTGISDIKFLLISSLVAMTFDSYLYKTVVPANPLVQMKITAKTIGSLLRGNALAYLETLCPQVTGSPRIVINFSGAHNTFSYFFTAFHLSFGCHLIKTNRHHFHV